MNVEQEITRIKETPTVTVEEELDDENEVFFDFDNDTEVEKRPTVKEVETQKLTTIKSTQAAIKEGLKELINGDDDPQPPISPAA
ncbi:hypothetical protein [Legionella tunisiensis]|uniref:hypothetical protein n=1 Tax=Legionella tunisiensis TaxID=1034944 RepID=UPI00031C1F1A|nr:hypothetical protein [Legionella tunisiensis]